MNLRQLQQQVNEWARANFGPASPPFHRPLVGANEEMGEFCGALADQLLEMVPVLLALKAMGNVDRAQLKSEQGIRGTAEEHEAKAKDGIADVVIYLCDYANQRGWDMQEIVEHAWNQTVKKRNWRANPETGQAKSDPEKALQLFVAAAEKFIGKVETGRAQSVETYTELKEALAVHRGSCGS